MFIYRIIPYIFLTLFTHLSMAHAANLYQVDLLIFAHSAATPQSLENQSNRLLAQNSQHAISLQNDGGTSSPYHILPVSASQLHNEYWTLSRKPEYQIIAYYSWLQPANNQHAVQLPQQARAGWNLEGTVRIRQSNYYLLDTDLLFSSMGHQQTSFLFSQKQRLKPKTVYYLDHPQVGMLIKVHQIT